MAIKILPGKIGDLSGRTSRETYSALFHISRMENGDFRFATLNGGPDSIGDADHVPTTQVVNLAGLAEISDALRAYVKALQDEKSRTRQDK